MSQQRWIFIVAGLSVATGLAIVAGCLGVLHFGLEMTTEEVRQGLEANPKFVERVGRVHDFKMDRLASFNDDDEDVWIYDVKGEKLSGRLTVKHETADDGSERIIWARMTLPTGEVVDLAVDEIENEE